LSHITALHCSLLHSWLAFPPILHPILPYLYGDLPTALYTSLFPAPNAVTRSL
jgi:hypothetical protein